MYVTRLPWHLTLADYWRLTVSAEEADAGRMGDVGERPLWDEVAARGFLGKDVLVGLTFARPSGEAIVQVQLHGEVTRVDALHGIGLTRAGTDEVFWLPPASARSRTRSRASTACARRVRSWSTRICSRPGRSLSRRTRSSQTGAGRFARASTPRQARSCSSTTARSTGTRRAARGRAPCPSATCASAGPWPG